MKKWYEEGQEPDYRFTLANERTFLAWVRTGLGFFVGAIATDQLNQHLRKDSNLDLIFYFFILISSFCIINGYLRWKRNERSMRNNKPIKYGNINMTLSILTASLLVLLILMKI